MEIKQKNNRPFQIGIIINLIAMLINICLLFVLLTIYRLEFLDYFWDIIVLIFLLPTIINIFLLLSILDEKKNYERMIIPTAVLSFLFGLLLGIIGVILMLVYKPKKVDKK